MTAAEHLEAIRTRCSAIWLSADGQTPEAKDRAVREWLERQLAEARQDIIGLQAALEDTERQLDEICRRCEI